LYRRQRARQLSSTRISASFSGHPSRGRTLADAVTEAVKLVRIDRAQPILFLRREEHGPVLSADYDWLALRGVEKSGEAQLGFSGRYRAHDSPCLSNLDKQGT